MDYQIFFGTTLFQNIILFSTAFCGQYAYRNNQREKEKTASWNILSYIDEINSNIESIPKDIIDENGTISEKSLFHANTIYHINQWENNKNIIKKRLSNEEFYNLNSYFLKVNNLKYYIIELKSMLIGSLQAKANYYYNSIYNKVGNIQIKDIPDEGLEDRIKELVRSRKYLYNVSVVEPYLCKEHCISLKSILNEYHEIIQNNERADKQFV